MEYVEIPYTADYTKTTEANQTSVKACTYYFQPKLAFTFSKRVISRYSILLFLLIPLLLYSNLTHAQHSHDPMFGKSLNRIFRNSDKVAFIAEAGISVVNSDLKGASNNRIVNLIKSNGFGPNGRIGIYYQHTPYFGVLSSIEYLHLRDQLHVNARTAPNQSYSFSSIIISNTSSAVVHFANKATLAKLYTRSFRGILIVPYLTGGAGFLVFTTSSVDEGQEELARRANPNIALVLPIGGGIKIRVAEQISLASNLILNVPTTDYLDNRKGNNSFAGSNDPYGSISLRVFYTLSKRYARYRTNR